MPRKRRAQPGSSGGAYQNRTDLSQPVKTPTGMPYGQAQQLQQAQQQMPVHKEAAVDPFASALHAAQGHDFAPVQLNAPTARPNEPVQAGLRSGPGPGPEVLGGGTGISGILERLVAESGNESLRALLDNARRMGL